MLPQPSLKHDIRNKLWAALEGLKFVLDRPQRGPQLLPKIKDSLEQALELLEDGRQCEHRHDLNKMLSGSLHDLTLLAKKKGVKLEIILEDGEIPVNFDKLAFLRIIQNLAINAIEAANSHVVVKAGFWSQDYGSTVRPAVAVQDDGAGIPYESLNSVFRPQISSKGPLRGQGLHIVRTLLEQSRGSLAAFTSSRGSSFYVILPPW